MTLTLTKHGLPAYDTVSVTQGSIASCFLDIPTISSSTDNQNGTTVQIYGCYGRESNYSFDTVLEFSFVDASDNELTMDVVGIEGRTNSDYHVTGVTKHRLCRPADGTFQDKLNSYEMGIVTGHLHLGQRHTSSARRKPFAIFHTYVGTTSVDQGFQRTMCVLTSTTRPSRIKFGCLNLNCAFRSWYYTSEADGT